MWAQGVDCSQCPRQPSFPDECREDEPIVWNVFDDQEQMHHTCPVFLMIGMQRVFQGYALFDKGQLPDPGGWLQQQEWWMQAFEVIGAEVRRVEQEKRKTDQPGSEGAE